MSRLRGSGIAIVQIVVAATAAFSFAHYVLGHEVPLLAATVTVSSLGLVRDARPRRVLETVVGMVVGIAVAELLFTLTGTGWWQLALALGATLVIARLLSSQPGFAMAAAIQSLIVMIIPASSPFSRLIDGAIGGVAALLVTALIPRDAVRSARRDGAAVFAAFEAAGGALVQALRRGDRLRGERGLTKARGLQPLLDRWRESLDTGLGIARISPFLRRQRAELERQERVHQSMDLASRNLRVIARRAAYLVDDGVPRPVAADLIAEMLRAATLIAHSLDDIADAPAARASLIALAGRLDPAKILPEASLGDQNLIAALRPFVVDLLTATGMPHAEARAVVPRI
nr:FUSC family protein [Microbacterium thalassium]